MSRMSVCIALAMAVCAPAKPVLGSGRTEVAEVRDRLLSTAPHWDRGGSGPLCGVYSTCIALGLSGIDCAPADYMSVSYVGPAGSTPQQIASIAESVDAKATVISGMSALELRWLDFPLIANVRSTPESEAYDHWVVVTYRDGEILLYDRMRSPVRIPTAEFLGVWSGVGVVVSGQGETVLPFLWLTRLALLQLGVLAVLVMGRVLPLSRGRSHSLARNVGAIIAVTAVLMAAGMTIFGDWSHFSSGIRIAAAPYSETSHRSGTLEGLHAASQRQDVLLIDARMSSDYRSGTVPGAVNIPVYASLWEIEEFLAGTSRDIPVMVFCQSERCTWDDAVAANLSLLGFTEVRVSSKGWAEYREKYRS